MAWMMFFIFLATDLITVLAVKITYGKKERYSRGMVLGVQIPEEAADSEEVRRLCGNYRRRGGLFQWINLAAGCAVCFVCFFSINAFLLIWCLWFAEYLGGTYYFIIHYHREMYRLKRKNGWIRQNSPAPVRVDMKTAAASDKMPVSRRWHLISAAFLAASAAILLQTVFSAGSPQGGTSADGIPQISSAAGEMLLFLLIGAGEALFFFLMHLWIARRANAVYSGDSRVNFEANRALKRAMTAGMAVSSIVSCAVTAFTVFFLSRFAWISDSLLIVYIAGQMLSALLLLVILFYARSKKAALLSEDPEPVVADDDEYWKKGWYSNPHDRRLFVQDRMNDLNYSMNMAHPASKVILTVTALLIASCVLVLLFVTSVFSTAEVEFHADGENVRIEGAFYSCEFQRPEIASVRLIDALPKERFRRTNGGETEEYAIGHFRGEETGRCMMFLYKDETPILEIKGKKQIVFVNSRQSAETERWYNELEQM